MEAIIRSVEQPHVRKKLERERVQEHAEDLAESMRRGCGPVKQHMLAKRQRKLLRRAQKRAAV